MAIIGTDGPRTYQQLLTDHLHDAGLTIRTGAVKLKVSEYALRRYVNGEVDFPAELVLSANQIRMRAEKRQQKRR